MLTKEQWDKIKSGEAAVNCLTEELAKEYLNLLAQEGFAWLSGDSLQSFTNWGTHAGNTCYCANNRYKVVYSSKETYKCERKEIICYEKAIVTTSAIKPCIRCGHTPEIEIRCNNCDCSITTRATPDVAIKSWNDFNTWPEPITPEDKSNFIFINNRGDVEKSRFSDDFVVHHVLRATGNCFALEKYTQLTDLPIEERIEFYKNTILKVKEWSK